MTVSRTLLAGAAALALCVTAQAKPIDQKALEAAFDAGVNSADQLEWLKAMSSAPNPVGSPHDKANAEYMLGLFKSWGWDAHIETFQVLYPTPTSTTVELVLPEHIQLGGQEPPMPGDDTSSNTAGALPPYVAFQGDGDVTADLVYVNFGMPDDYKALARRGIDVKGKIVIARYGVGWRGLKPLLAQWHGAAGAPLQQPRRAIAVRHPERRRSPLPAGVLAYRSSNRASSAASWPRSTARPPCSSKYSTRSSAAVMKAALARL